MKVKRHKKVQKHMSFYVNNFSFRQPFQVLIDGTFCLAALKNKINIKEQLPKYMQADLKLLTTQCVIIETDSFGPKLSSAAFILKQFPVHKCGHDSKPLSGAKCLRSMVRNQNSNRYVIASQDRDLQEKLRKIPAVPVMYLHRVAPILEQPSEATLEAAKNKVNATFGVSSLQVKALERLKKDADLDEVVEEKPKRRKKKGPNPLSCKKKKKKPLVGVNKTIDKRKGELGIADKKKKKKIRIAKHVLEEIKGLKK